MRYLGVSRPGPCRRPFRLSRRRPCQIAPPFDTATVGHSFFVDEVGAGELGTRAACREGPARLAAADCRDRAHHRNGVHRCRPFAFSADCEAGARDRSRRCAVSCRGARRLGEKDTDQNRCLRVEPVRVRGCILCVFCAGSGCIAGVASFARGSAISRAVAAAVRPESCGAWRADEGAGFPVKSWSGRADVVARGRQLPLAYRRLRPRKHRGFARPKRARGWTGSPPRDGGSWTRRSG